MVMADPLCYIKELALKELNPQLFTMATLTGHVIRAYGTNYTVKNLKKIDNLLIVFLL
jgi:leucyl aminopeptidase